MITRYETTKILSKVLVANGFAFLSGLTAKERPDDVRAQTADILAQIDEYLSIAGTDKSRIVVANVWLKNVADFDKMNEAWMEWVDPNAQPARATVESRLARENILVEIQVQALV